MQQNLYKIIFENEFFLVVSKSCGVNFHNEKGVGLVSLLKEDLKIELYPIHRLDKVTSGLIIFGKSSSIANEFSQLFINKEMNKFYIAISSHKPKKKMGKISGDMEKSRNKSWKLLRSNLNPAITIFKSYSLSPGLKFFLLKPLTGKTHQLRVALKSIGSPILGDEIYASSEDKSDRTYLHSYFLNFILYDKEYSFIDLPTHGEQFTSELFKKLIKDFDKPWEKI